MKVLLINPPLEPTERFDKLSEKEISTVPPLGLCYIASYLEKNNIKVSIWDGLVDSGDDKYSIKTIKKEKPDIIGITASTISMPKAIRIANLIKTKINPKIPIILGGPHASALPEDTLKKCKDIDIIVIGEGEETFKELTEHIEGKKKLDSIAGISYRSGKKIITTSQRKLIENLDTLPHPARHLLPDLEKYSPARKYKRFPVSTMITSRGCPFRCIFCDHSIFGKSYRTNSAEYVIEEIEELTKKHNIKEISFADDNFMLDRKRVEKICDLLLEKGIDITWTCQGRVGNPDLKLFRKMKKAGCWLLHVGIESGNTQILKDIKKDITKEQVITTINTAQKAGIQTWGFFMLGHPNDNHESMMDTVNFAASLNLDYIGFNIAVPYPGSELHAIAKKSGTFKINNYSDYMVEPNNPVYVAENTTKEELLKIKKIAYRKFYLSPKRIIKHIRNIENIHDIEKYYYGAINLFKR